jgi:hypothetical protein
MWTERLSEKRVSSHQATGLKPTISSTRVTLDGGPPPALTWPPDQAHGAHDRPRLVMATAIEAVHSEGGQTDALSRWDMR